MKITKTLLESKGACKEQVEKFNGFFPNGVELTLAICLKHAQDFNWHWAADKLLPAPARKAYKEAVATALRTYNEAEATALRTYNEAEATAGEAYKEAVATAGKAYKEAAATAGEAYNDTKATAWKAYDDAKATAFFNCSQMSHLTPLFPGFNRAKGEEWRFPTLFYPY